MFRFLFDKDTWQELRESLTKNKLRTIITMIGVWWGILLLIGLLGSRSLSSRLFIIDTSPFDNEEFEKETGFEVGSLKKTFINPTISNESRIHNPSSF